MLSAMTTAVAPLRVPRTPGPDQLEWSRAVADSRYGLPLAWTLTAANRNDVTQLMELLDRVPPVREQARH
jgi:hypothetical protein